MSDDLNRAIALYVGWDAGPSPQHDESRVIKQFGEAKGRSLLGQVDLLLTELFEIDMDWSAHDLASGTTWAVDHLAARHPELNERGKEALAWTYAYSNK